VTTDPVEEFVLGLRRLGANPERRGGLIVYEIEPCDGALAGQVVLTAVEAAELAGWPVAPPHWVHFAASVAFPATNSQASELPSWLRHSRQVSSWGADADPTQAWLAHVRRIIGDAR
jgi:hypothetical protein